MDFLAQVTQLGVPVVTTALTLTVAAPLTGGGDLSDDRTLGLSYDSTLQVSGVSLGVSALVALASHTHAPTAIGAEPAMGNPGTSGYVLSSTTGGVRSWAAPGAFSGVLGASQGGTGTNNGTYTLTVPATGTAALLGTAQTFTAAQVLSVSGVTPLDIRGLSDDTGRITLRLSSAASGAGTFIQFTDTATYNAALGASGVGDLAFYDTRYPGNLGTLRFGVGRTTGTATITGGLNVGSATGATAGQIRVPGMAGQPSILIAQNTGSPVIELRDGAATPNRWWVGQDTSGANNGTFYVYDARQAKMALTIDTSQNTSLSGNLTAGTSSTTIGTHPIYSATYGAVWRGTDGYALLFDATDTFVNSRSGAIYFRDNNVDRAAITSTGLSVTGALLVNGSYAPGGSVSIDVQQAGSAAGWYGRIATRNATGDKAVFLGTYGAICGVFAHNNALTAWADLYVNTVDGIYGGNVRLPNGTVIAGQAWQSLSLGTGWVASGYGTASARYWKDALGVVHLGGLVAAVSDKPLIGTLPVGYRPDTNLVFPAASSESAYTPYKIVQVWADGRVTYNGTINALAWLSLEGITFRAA